MKDNNSCVVVIVNYFNEAEINLFVPERLLKQKGIHSVVIVDNGSHDKEILNKLSSKYNNIYVLSPGKNLGYLGGFVYAVEKSNINFPEWVVLSNSDIEFSNLENMNQLMNVKEVNQYAVLGPSIISTRTQHNQNPFYAKRISFLKLNFLRTIYRSYILYFIYQLLYNLKSKLISYRKPNRRSEVENVYSIHGAFMMFRTSFIKKNVSKLRNAPFLFGEEIYLAELALAAGVKTGVVYNVIIRHFEHATTGLFKTKKNLKLLRQSLDFLYRERKNAIEQN